MALFIFMLCCFSALIESEASLKTAYIHTIYTVYSYIALPCLLSGGENEDRKWADGAGEQGKRGEWRDEHRLRKIMEKGTDDWRDRKRKGGRAGGMDKWLGERREADRRTFESVLRAWKDTVIRLTSRKMERKNIRWLTGDLNVRGNSDSYVISFLKY